MTFSFKWRWINNWDFNERGAEIKKYRCHQLEMEPLEEMENERIRWNWIRFHPKSSFVSTKRLKIKIVQLQSFFLLPRFAKFLKKEKSDYLAPLPLKNAPKALDSIDLNCDPIFKQMFQQYQAGLYFRSKMGMLILIWLWSGCSSAEGRIWRLILWAPRWYKMLVMSGQKVPNPPRRKRLCSPIWPCCSLLNRSNWHNLWH